MSSTLVNVADKVRTTLAASLSREVGRSWVPDIVTPKEVDTARIDVVPTAIVFERESRAGWRKTIQVDIGVRQRVRNDDTEAAVAAADSVMELVGRITDALETHKRFDDVSASLVGITLAPTFDAELLRNLNVLATAMNVTYMVNE